MLDITICHLYPDHLNLYGDRGNVLALFRRARWHGLSPRLIPVRPGYRVDFSRCDILFMGGGQDAEQKMVFRDFCGRCGELRAAIEKGMVVLAVCGSYQLLGSHYITDNGECIDGLGLLDLYTEAGPGRLTGDLVVRSHLWDPPRTIVGFENHGGRTYLGPGLKPLGIVIAGNGNNGRDKTEGAVWRNVIGTYLHGSLLPKNPWLTDYLLARALEYRGLDHSLPPLDDTLEREAHQYIVRRNRSLLFRLRTPAFYRSSSSHRRT